jgi:hypothetical protein
MNFRLSKALLACAVLAVLVLGTLAAYQQFESKRHELAFGNRPRINVTIGDTSPIDWVVLNTIAGLTESFDNLVQRGVFTRDDLEKLDFTQAGEQGYGNNSEWGVYTPHGRLFPEGKGGTAVEPWIMEALTGDKNLRAIFNLRRHVSIDGKVDDALYLIISNVKKNKCLQYYKPLREYAANPIMHIDVPAEIASDTHRVVVDSFEMPGRGGCVQFHDKNIYLFLPFYGRTQMQGK